MLGRVLVGLSIGQVLLMYAPSPAWRWWMLHLVALELSLVAVVTGAAGLGLSRGHPFLQGLALLGVVGGLLPALATAPLYVRLGVPFSPIAWLTGGPSPDVALRRDVALIPSVAADIYSGVGERPRPWLVVIHGGSWRSGGKGDGVRLSRTLANDGYTVFDIDYPLDPFPTAIEHVACAIAEIQARAADLGVDPARGALLGRSAGGQIALVAAYASGRVGGSCPIEPLKAVVGIYAPTDLAWAYDNPYVPDVVEGTDALRVYLGGTPSERPDAYRAGTPMSWLDQPVPATLLIHGTAERCVRPVNTERLRDALLARGQTVETLFIPFADHGFDIRAGGFAEQLARARIRAFLRARL